MVAQKRIILDAGNRRGLEDATNYVTRGWFPINPARVKDLKTKLAAGTYKARREQFFDDIKEDAALFAACLRALGKVCRKEEHTLSPAEVLRSLDQVRIEALLAVALENPPAHELDSNQKPQLMQIRHSLISAGSAEALALGAKCDADTAFTAAAVRQLGMNLVAWNYPRIYSKALQSVKNGAESLDQALFRTLGYSPLVLGQRVAVDWNECVALQDAVMGSESVGEGSQLRRFCEIGEVIAQVSDAEHFPAAAARWDQAVQDVTSLLGPEGFSQIEKRIARYANAYQALGMPQIKIDLSVEKNLKAAVEIHSSNLLAKNPFVQKLGSDLIDKFKSVYSEIVPGQPSATAVQVLVSDVIPALGFTCGCVYLVDTRRMQVVPMLRIGASALDRYRPLSCGDSVEANHPAVAALSYSAPIVQENALLHGDRVNHITGVFGNRDKPGVLYLEMSERLSDGQRQDVLQFFKAIRQCLADCLNMRE